MSAKMLFPLVFLFSLLPLSLCSQLKNVTSSVFGSHAKDLALFPVAFGDFNSDKLTDLFVLSSDDRSKVSVLLSEPQTFSIDSSETYFDSFAQARSESLVCTLDKYDIVSAAPADFDGDGGMDLMLVTRPIGGGEGKKLEVKILWGSHQGKEHKLLCPKDSEDGSIDISLEMDAEPLILDGNGDNVADLFGAVNGTRGVWTFRGGRQDAPVYTTLDGKDDALKLSPLRSPHSNAFVDLDTDGNADLFVTTEKDVELWSNVGSQADQHFKIHRTVPYPSHECGDASSGDCIGQAVFADFDLDGRLDVVFPACVAKDCADSRMYFATMEHLWSGEHENFKEMGLIMEGWQFDTAREGDGGNIYRGLSPHVGDINLDGYPDLLLRLKDRETGKSQMQVLLNVENKMAPERNARGFLLQPEVMQGINDTVMATFYDLYENGLEDIILVQRKGDEFEIGAYTNITQDSDAYFVKVIVLSGKFHI